MTERTGMLKRIELSIEGMTCAHCLQHVREAIGSLAGVGRVDVSLDRGRAIVGASEDVEVESVLGAVEAAGYFSGGTLSEREGAARAGMGGGSDGRSLLVIGGGSAAFAAAIRASDLGARVTMVERGVIGGTCVNRGCVPSKTLIRAADMLHLGCTQPFAGLHTGNGAVEMSSLVDQKRALVERLRRSKYRDVLAAHPGIELVEGEARFTGEREIELNGPDGRSRRVQPDRVIIATGARPWIPDLPGLEEADVWTNEEALEAEEVPRQLVVVGGGPVGVELAQLFSRLGSRVSLIAPRLVPGSDPELAGALTGYLRAEGMDVVTGSRLSRVVGAGSGRRAVAELDDGRRSLPFDRLLIATGRIANTEALNLETAGLETVGRGFIRVNDRLQTNRAGIYAAGDCTDQPHFVYVAAKAGTVAADNAFGGESRLDLSAMPAVIFTDPQLAWVGLTEAEARHRGEEVDVRSLSMEHVPRALANRDTRGLIKIVARRRDRRVLGVHVLSPQAGDVVGTGVLAVKQGLTVDDLADTLFPYLTEVEGLKLAAQSFRVAVERLSCCAG